MLRCRVVDSHTEGEPTRVLIDGIPHHAGLDFADALKVAREQYEQLLSWTVREPRGSDVVVGAVLTPPVSADAACGAIFYNNVGLLGMCGHGTIGLVRTLQFMGRITAGVHRIDTPVGPVTATLCADGSVAVQNVPSYRVAKGIEVDVPGLGRVSGDIAYGGNWFYLMALPQPFGYSDVGRLLAHSTFVRRAVNALTDPPEAKQVDHVEIFGPPSRPENDSRNFVLCPGLAYDRSPCGTGLSAKLACLAADGKLQSGEVWRQESIVGTQFTGRFEHSEDGKILPTISGRAWITAESELVFESSDPFPKGIC